MGIQVRQAARYFSLFLVLGVVCGNTYAEQNECPKLDKVELSDYQVAKPIYGFDYLPANPSSGLIKTKKGAEIFSWDKKKVYTSYIVLKSPVTVNRKALFLIHAKHELAPVGRYETKLVSVEGASFNTFEYGYKTMDDGYVQIVLFFSDEMSLCGQYFKLHREKTGKYEAHKIKADFDHLNASLEKGFLRLSEDAGSIYFLGLEDGVVSLDIRSVSNGEIRERKKVQLDSSAAVGKQVAVNDFSLKIFDVNNDMLSLELIKK